MSQMVLKVLTDSEIEKFHEKTLDVFENVGIKVTHDEALKVLKKRGANVDDASQIVRFPRTLVKELMSQAAIAPASGINGRKLEIGGNNRHYMSLILDPFINDYKEGKRPPRLEDVRRHTIIGESLDRISVMMRMQIDITDVPSPDCYLKTMEVFLSHLTKHVSIYPTSVENCREWLDVYEVIAEAAGINVKTTPLLSIAMAVTSPLQVHGLNVDIMKMAMERCYPVISTVCHMAGTTSPYSVAGTALISNVEALSPVLIAQAYKPGHPVLYGWGPSVTDLRSGHDLYYKAEKMLWKTIVGQMGKFYGLPIVCETGGSLTHRPDMQNGAESFAYMLTSHVNGQNLFGGVGSMGNANGMSQEQIIMQCGLIDMAEYLANGVDTSDYKLAYESIKKIGPGGNYLIDDLTMELMHSKEFFTTPYFDLSGGYHENAKGIYEIAHETANQLVADYKPTVPEKVRKAIKSFFAARYKDKARRGYVIYMKMVDSKVIFKGAAGTTANTVSFSNLMLRRNGELLATARLGSGKDTADGNVGIWRSADGGKNWSSPVRPFATEFEGKRGCLRTGCVTELPDGRLLMTLAWVDRSVEGRGLYNDKTGGLCNLFPVISESNDGGVKWSPLRRVDLFPITLPSALTGPTLVLPDDGIACQFELQKTWDSDEPIFNISAFKISYDAGKTWPEYMEMAGRPRADVVCWDQRIAQFPSGRMVNFFWTYNTVKNVDHTIHVNFSNEHGRNWSRPVDTGIVGQIACPVIMSESHVVLLYVRRDEKRQILARQSFDGGKTWDANSEIVLYNQAGSANDSANLFDAMNQWSYGHPCGIKISDSEIAAVYYAGQGSHTSLNFCMIQV